MALFDRGARPESPTLGYRNELDPRFPLTLPNLARILHVGFLSVPQQLSTGYTPEMYNVH